MTAQFLRYAFVGLAGTVLHLALMALAVEGAGWDPLAGAGLGFLGALTLSYGLNKRWTFASKRRHAASAWRYVAVSVLGLGVNSLLLGALVHGLGFWYFGAQLAVIFVVPLMNFALNRYWTFNDQEPPR